VARRIYHALARLALRLQVTINPTNTTATIFDIFLEKIPKLIAINIEKADALFQTTKTLCDYQTQAMDTSDNDTKRALKKALAQHKQTKLATFQRQSSLHTMELSILKELLTQNKWSAINALHAERQKCFASQHQSNFNTTKAYERYRLGLLYINPQVF